MGWVDLDLLQHQPISQGNSLNLGQPESSCPVHQFEMRTRGQNTEKFADVIEGCSLVRGEGFPAAGGEGDVGEVLGCNSIDILDGLNLHLNPHLNHFSIRRLPKPCFSLSLNSSLKFQMSIELSPWRLKSSPDSLLSSPPWSRHSSRNLDSPPRDILDSTLDRIPLYLLFTQVGLMSHKYSAQRGKREDLKTTD